MKRLAAAILISTGIVGAAQADGLGDAKRGFTAAQRGDHQEAVYFSALAIRSGELDEEALAVAHNNRGFAYDQLGRTDKAIRDYSSAIRLDPDFAIAHNNRGYAFNDVGLYRQAVADFTQAILLKPEYADAFNNRGIAHAQLGDLDGAVSDYSQAIRLKPTLYQAHNNRGYALFNLGRFAASARDLEVIIRVAPNNMFTAIWHHLAIYRSDGDGAAALREHSAAADLEQWPGALIRLFLGEGQPEDAIAAAKHSDPLRQRERDCELYFYLGQYYLLKGDQEKAVEAFSQALDTGLADFTEFSGAKAELDRIGPQKLSAAPADKTTD